MWPFRVSISFREALGVALVFASLVLSPVAWMWSRLLWAVALLLFFAGALLFLTSRMRDRQRELDNEGAAAGDSGPAVPSDVHDYTGWQHGGRSETMDSDSGTDDN